MYSPSSIPGIGSNFSAVLSNRDKETVPSWKQQLRGITEESKLRIEARCTLMLDDPENKSIWDTIEIICITWNSKDDQNIFLGWLGEALIKKRNAYGKHFDYDFNIILQTITNEDIKKKLRISLTDDKVQQVKSEVYNEFRKMFPLNKSKEMNEKLQLKSIADKYKDDEKNLNLYVTHSFILWFEIVDKISIRRLK